MESKDMEGFFAIGKQGKIIQTVFDTSDFVLEQIRKKAPLLEEGYEYLIPKHIVTINSNTDKIIIKEAISQYYKEWGKYGTNDDLIIGFMIRKPLSNSYYISRIARFSYNLAGFAADLVLFIKNEKSLSFIGIKRKHNPGKDLPALIGGFRDVNNYNFETPLETIIREAEEEIGLKICPLADINIYPHGMVPEKINVEVNIGEICHFSSLNYVGQFKTGDEENNVNTNTKRVYETTAYSLVIEVEDDVLTDEEIAKMFFPNTSEVSEIIAISAYYNIKFGISHHEQIYREALLMI